MAKKTIKRRTPVSKKFIPQASIVSDELYIPNLSGEHTAGTTDTPVTDRQIANKKYVDDKEVESFPTSLTSGSIPFSDGSNLTQDNSNLYWDTSRDELQPNRIKITSDGSQAAPALNFNDTNTGFFKSGDSIRLSINNSTKMTVLGNGNVGIGTASPTEPLTVDGNVLVIGIREAILLTNLLGYWKLDGDSTDEVASVDGADTDITYSDANGIINNGAGFNGSTSDIKFGDNHDTSTGAFSVSLWFKTSDTGSFKQLIGKTRAQANNSWEVRVRSDNKVEGTFREGANTDNAVSVGTVTDGAFHHVVFTRPAAGGNVSLYVDAGSPVTVTNNSRNTDNAFQLVMGVTDNGILDFTGAIDEVGIWNRELSSVEVTELNNSGVGNQYPFIVVPADTFFVDAENNKVGIGTATPTNKFSVSEKSGMSAIGGFCIKLTNTTGANTIAGQLVRADTATNDAVIITDADNDECLGVFLESGIADDAEAWVVISGIADVAMEDNTTATRGNWVRTSVTEAGYADATNLTTPQPASFVHMTEIGHCIETVTAGGEGTHILARCVLHFN